MAAIKAIYDDDLIEFLQNIGLYSKLSAGKVKCKFCGNIVTIENFLAVFPSQNKILISCNLPDCVKQLNEGND